MQEQSYDFLDSTLLSELSMYFTQRNPDVRLRLLNHPVTLFILRNALGHRSHTLRIVYAEVAVASYSRVLHECQ